METATNYMWKTFARFTQLIAQAGHQFQLLTLQNKQTKTLQIWILSLFYWYEMVGWQSNDLNFLYWIYSFSLYLYFFIKYMKLNKLICLCLLGWVGERKEGESSNDEPNLFVWFGEKYVNKNGFKILQKTKIKINFTVIKLNFKAGQTKWTIGLFLRKGFGWMNFMMWLCYWYYFFVWV